MTWGYWGIVAGLLLLVGVFFICMEIVYARAKNGENGQTGSSSGIGASRRKKHAA